MASSSSSRPAPQDRNAASLASPTETGGNVDATVDSVARAAGPAPAGALQAGATLDVYELVEKLGEGGMGSVWKARHRKLDKLVALKVLPAHLTSDAAAVSRFEREMKAVGKLEHPHIVRAMDAGDFGGIHYLVMELVEGSDLNGLVRERGPRSVSEACQMVRQAALGLAHAHEYGLVHRDIKPSNLLLSKQGQVKILDLGLARLQDDGGDVNSGLTAMGAVLGTPDYMSPEQWESTHTAGPPCDLYALGCTLFYLLIGRAPFGDEQHSTMVQKMKGHALEVPPRVRSLRPDVPEEVDELCAQLLAKRPEDRLGSAKALATQLQNFLKQSAAEKHERHKPIVLPADGGPVSSTMPTVASNPIVVTATPGQKKTSSQPARRRSSLPLWIGGGAAVMALLLGGLWAAGILLRVETPVGTIVLEIDQPEAAGAEVTVDGQKKITLRPGADQELVTIVADEKRHELRVSKGGFEVFTKEFTLNADKTSRIAVRLDPLKSKPSSGPTAIAPTKDIPPVPSVAATAAAAGPVSLSTGGHALRLDGRSAYVEVPWKYEGGHPLTVEAWTIAERPSDDPRPECLFGDMEVAGWGLMRIGVPEDPTRKLRFYVHDGSYHRIAAPQPLAAGKAVHLAAVYDGQEGRLYIDGKLQAREPIAGGFTRSAVPTLIGGNPNVGSLAGIDALWQGVIDEVRFSKSARYTADFRPESSLQPDGDTIVLYHFDEGRGSEAQDSSGNGRHAKVLGGAWIEAPSGKLVNLVQPPLRDPSAGAAVAMLGGGSVALPTLTYSGGPITLEAWVWHSLPALHTPNHSPAVVQLSPFALKFYAPKQRYEFLISDKPKIAAISSKVEGLLPGQWVHLAGQWDEKAFSLFVNGQPAGQDYYVQGISGQPTPEQFLAAIQDMLASSPRTAAGLSGSPVLDAYHWTGALDEIRISSKARYTDAFAPAARFEADEHTLVLLHCDEGQGERLLDASGKNHHGEFRGRANQWAWITDEGCRPAVIPTAADPQRALAEWTIRSGGTVSITQGNAFPKFDSLAALPAGKLRIAEINLEDSTAIDDADLRLLRGLDDGANLNMSYTPITASKLLDEIAGKKLWHVTLNGIFLTKDDVERLAGLPDIGHRLYMGESGLSDELFAPLAKAGNLVSLNISGTRVSDASIVRLATHGKLTLLTAWQTPLTDESLKDLTACKDLKSVDVTGTRVTADGIQKFKEALPECQVIWDPAATFRPAATDREVVRWVLQHGGKAAIYQSGRGTREAHAADLKSPRFRDTWISAVNLTDCKTIRNEDLVLLPGLVGLRSLTLHNTPVSPAAVLDQVEQIPAIEALGLNGLKPTPADIVRLAKLPKLKAVMIWDSGLTDAELMPLLDLAQLHSLNLGNSKLTDAGLERLHGRPELVLLQVSHTGITDEGLKTLASCPNLAELYVDGTKVSEPAVRELAKALPRCTIYWDGGVLGPGRR